MASIPEQSLHFQEMSSEGSRTQPQAQAREVLKASERQPLPLHHPVAIVATLP